MTQRINIVLVDPLVHERGTASRLPRSLQHSHVNLFIVDSDLYRQYDDEILASDQGLLDDANSLTALKGTDNVVFSSTSIAEFKLPKEARPLDTVYLYYKSMISTGINDSFDVMCVANDFPLKYPSSVRRYIVVEEGTTVDVNGIVDPSSIGG